MVRLMNGVQIVDKSSSEMSAGFGFSVSDVIAATGLIKKSIQAIQNRRAASEEYQLLTAELESLEAALVAISNLPSHILSQDVAVNSAIHNCRRCLENFRKEIVKYQSSLETSVGGLRTNIRRIQWALCKKDDITSFRSQIAGHASSINMLLITLGVHQTLKVQQAQDTYSSTVAETCNTTAEISRSAVASQDILESVAMIVPQIMQNQTNLAASLQSKGAVSEHQLLSLENMLPQLLKGILDLQCSIQMQKELPPQVLLSKPIVLSDACGHVAAFHLDFITSMDVFLAVLKARFKENGVSQKGLKKLDRSEFVFRDRHKYLSLAAPWQRVFRPGQVVEMSMVFHRLSPFMCPACQQHNQSPHDSDLTW